MTIKDFVKLCKKKFYLIIVIPIICGLVATFVCYGILTNDYTSSVSIYVLQHNENSNQSLSTSDVTTSQQLSNDIAVLAKSNRVKDSVKEEMGLDDLDNFTIKVSSAEKNRVINISCTGKNPKSTAQVVNCIARQTATLAVEVMNVDAVNIIEEAQPSTAPSGPHRLLIIMLSILAGILISFGVIVLSDMMDTTVTDETMLKEQFDLPVLAQVPYIKKLK